MDVWWGCSFRGNVHCESGKLRTARHPALTAMLSVAHCTAAQRQAVCFWETGLGLAAVRGPAPGRRGRAPAPGSEEHTSELQSRGHPVCRLLLGYNNYSIF